MDKGAVIAFLIFSLIAIGLHIVSAVSYYLFGDSHFSDDAQEKLGIAICTDIVSYIAAFVAVVIYVRAFF